MSKFNTITEMYEDSSRWTHGAIARDKDGRIVSNYDEDACSWCLLGAVVNIYGWFNPGLWNKLQGEIGSGGITTWNDENGYEKVFALVKQLGI